MHRIHHSYCGSTYDLPTRVVNPKNTSKSQGAKPIGLSQKSDWSLKSTKTKAFYLVSLLSDMEAVTADLRRLGFEVEGFNNKLEPETLTEDQYRVELLRLEIYQHVAKTEKARHWKDFDQARADAASLPHTFKAL